MIYNEEYETMPREALEAIQLRRLQTTVTRVYNTVPFYKKRFDEVGVKVDDVSSLDDLRRLPFTYKDNLRDSYPFGMSNPRLLGYHWEANRGGLHSPGHPDLV